MDHISLSMYVYTTLHCHTIVQLLYLVCVNNIEVTVNTCTCTIVQLYTQLYCVNNIEVTVNTCVCTDVFITKTKKDQSGGIYNSYSTGSQGGMIYGC